MCVFSFKIVHMYQNLFLDGYQSTSKSKRARAGHVKHKSIINFYNKMVDMVGCLSQLIYIQDLTDTTILQV